MLLPPFLKVGPGVVLGMLGCAIGANADTPTVLPTFVHPKGEATYVRESTVGTTALSPRSVAPGGGVAGVPGPQPKLELPSQSALPNPAMEDAKKLLEVLKTEKAGQLPLDLTVEKATLKEIVAQISKTLGEKAPRIEVHDEQPILLSFAIKDSTLREVLETTGGLAGVKVWVLPDHWVLAPETSLTADETRDMGGTSRQDMQRVFASLIAVELAGQEVGKRTTFSDLSPDGKAMLQGLVDKMNELNRERMDLQLPDGTASPLSSPFVLTPGTFVSLGGSENISGRNGNPVGTLSISQPNRGMRWATDGSSWGSTFSTPPRSKPSSGSGPATAPPLFDPSAHKS